MEIEKIIKRVDTLEGNMGDWRSYHEDICKWCLPRKGWHTTIKNVGERLQLNSVFDSTAILALRVAAAGFHSNLTNPSSKWFALRTRNIDFMQEYDARVWFKSVEDKIFSVLNSSNFDTMMQEFYVDACSVGTGAVMTLEDPIDKVRFTTIPTQQINLEEDSHGRVNRLFRTYELTVQQAFDQWGTLAGKTVMEKLAQSPNSKVTIIHCVMPRDAYDSNKADNTNMPFQSLWINKTDKHLIKESGFFEFPYAVGRFYKDGTDTFGFSPAMDALATIKLVNAQHKTMLRAAMKASDPALSVPSRGFMAPLSANPGVLNYRKAGTERDAIQAFPVSQNVTLNIEVIKMGQEAIEKAFFVPLFRSLSDITKQMTVPEVQRRIAESMVLLGPVVGRFTDEVLDPIISRVFSILYRNGELPPTPEILADQEMDIVYISPLAKAQRESEIYSIEAFLVGVGNLATVKPEVLDKIDGDAVVDIMAEVRGTNPKIIVDNEIVAQIRQQRAQALQTQQALAMVGQGAQIAESTTTSAKNTAEAESIGKE